MNKKLIILSVVSLMMIATTGCYKDIISPGQDPNGPPQPVSFSGDLLPIFTASCSLSGCHDVVPAHKPSLVAEKAYSALVDGGYVNTAVPFSSLIYTEIKSGSMPPGGALKASDTQKVLDWIRNGAPNN